MGVIGFAKSVALEGARYNVTCNVDRARHHRAQREPVARCTSAWSSAWRCSRRDSRRTWPSAIAFLCSERARYITGAVLTVTGGMDLFTF